MTKDINNLLYLDNAATTSLHPKAIEAMMPYLTTEYGNPSAVYSYARNARKAIEKAREQIAEVINCSAKEIIFTASGTEANNWVLQNFITNAKESANGCHIITSAVEHHAVSEVCKYLETKEGKRADVTYLPVDSEGNVSPESLINAIRPDTVLISMIWANNEIGTIFPIAKLAEIAREKGIPFHTDAVQAVGHIPIDMSKMPVDLLTMSAHKFYGPKGVGALYMRKGFERRCSTKFSPFLFGGAQERNLRASTENVAGIVGMGEALTLSAMEMDEEYNRCSMLRDYLIDRIEKEIPLSFLNGARGNNRLPGNVNFTFDYIEGESLLLLLDMNGICASSGSACSSASLEPSHVIMALGVPHEKAHGSIRFSLGRSNSQSDIDKLMEILPKLINQLRAMSPLAEGDSSWITMTK